MRSYLQIRTSTLRILIVGMRATPENVLGLFITGSFGTGSGPGSPDGQPGWGGGSDRLQPAMHKSFNARALRKQRVRQRGSTNTEPGADRGPQTASPAGVVVVATGCNLRYTNRSMRALRRKQSVRVNYHSGSP